MAEDHKMHGKKSGHQDKIMYALLIGLVIVSLANLTITSSTNAEMTNDMRLRAEENRPANISITKLLVPECGDCFDVDNAVSALKQLNIRIVGERYVSIYSDEGRELVKSYSISKAPTLIIQGEIEKSSVKNLLGQIGEARNDAVIYTRIEPAYLDTNLNRIVGRVNTTIIEDASCKECVNLSAVAGQLKQSGAVIKQQKTLDISSKEAERLIEKYNIDKAPALIISGDISAYNILYGTLLQMGTAEPDGTYVLRTISPPYRNLSANEVVGRVRMINLVDTTCEKCYNVSINRQILEGGYSVYVYNETSYDISSKLGTDLAGKYNITAVPTFLLSAEAGAYPNLMQIWGSVGTVEEDGWLVFRNIDAIQGAVYKNLTANQTGGA